MFPRSILEHGDFETLACKPPEDSFLGIFPIKYFWFLCIKNVGKRVGWYKECFVKQLWIWVFWKAGVGERVNLLSITIISVCNNQPTQKTSMHLTMHWSHVWGWLAVGWYSTASVGWLFCSKCLILLQTSLGMALWQWQRCKWARRNR